MFDDELCIEIESPPSDLYADSPSPKNACKLPPPHPRQNTQEKSQNSEQNGENGENLGSEDEEEVEEPSGPPVISVKEDFSPIEHRLSQCQKEYDQKREKLSETLKQAEIRELREKPSICKQSERILKEKEKSGPNIAPLNAPKKVDERLLERHQLMQKMQQLRIQDEERKVNKLNTNFIHFFWL